MSIEVLCGLHSWLCRHLSGIPFPATLDQEHPEWQMQQLPWFAVSGVECCECGHCTRFASHTPRYRNPGVSGPESAVCCKSLGEWASPLIRCARNCLPSLPTTIPSSTNLEMEDLVSLSVVFHSNTIIIWNPTMTFGTHCILEDHSLTVMKTSNLIIALRFWLEVFAATHYHINYPVSIQAVRHI
jgi:hypothetical protein